MNAEVLQLIIQTGNFGLLCVILLYGFPWAIQKHLDALAAIRAEYKKNHEENVAAMIRIAKALARRTAQDRQDKGNPDRGPHGGQA